jgi:iron-sulfur cluster repair protein YtfE (RIC family)
MMILEPTIAATCRLLVERYHRAFDEEMPRLESLAWKIAAARDVTPQLSRALMNALLELKAEVQRHTAVAEKTVHPFAGTSDGDVLLDEHLADHGTLRTLIKNARTIAADAPPTSRIAFALQDGLRTLERNLEMYFALERTLVTRSFVPSAGVTASSSSPTQLSSPS